MQKRGLSRQSWTLFKYNILFFCFMFSVSSYAVCMDGFRESERDEFRESERDEDILVYYPDSFYQAMTDGLILREGQDIFLKEYIGKKFRYHDDSRTSLQDILDVLKIYPKLSKRKFDEKILRVPINTSGRWIRRLRPLSLMEVPFRSCLSGSCDDLGTDTTLQALNPNRAYFTLTDSRHHSSGLIGLILGKSKNQEGKDVKVALLEEISQVQPEYVIAILDGIQSILRQRGYKLALPKRMVKPVIGILWPVSDEYIPNTDPEVRRYIESQVHPYLQTSLTDWTPLPPRYPEFFRDIDPANVDQHLFMNNETIASAGLLVFDRKSFKSAEHKVKTIIRAPPALSFIETEIYDHNREQMVEYVREHKLYRKGLVEQHLEALRPLLTTMVWD